MTPEKLIKVTLRLAYRNKIQEIKRRKAMKARIARMIDRNRGQANMRPEWARTLAGQAITDARPSDKEWMRRLDPSYEE